MVTRASLLISALVLAGCTVTIDPGVEDVKLPDTKLTPEHAAKSLPGEAPEAAVLTANFENNTFQIKKRAWNSKLALELQNGLRQMGATVDTGAEVRVSITGYHYNQSGVFVATFEIDVQIEVVVGDFRKTYDGHGETMSSSSNASWQAAGAALTKVLADAEFHDALKAGGE